jgi:tRNA(Ile)-lysidine synthase
MKVIATVRDTIRRHNLAGPRTRVVVALSGGSDSVALAHVLSELEASGELTLAGLAHFNHQLRVNADRDEQFAVSLAAAIGRPILVEREDVRLRAVREQRSIEDAAHAARHEFFDRALAHFDAGCVAVGHTRDDQAETFLLRLLRGAGPKGLAAMHPRNGPIVRPLLECRRADLKDYLVERGVQHVEDETNSDVSIPRNRVRAELLPLLESRFNPSIVDVLADQAELARGQWSWMEEELGALKLERGTPNPQPGTRNSEPGTWILDIPTLQRAPVALRRLAMWKAMTRAAGGRPVSFRHVEAALRLIESSSSDGPGLSRSDRSADRSIDAPGHIVERVGSHVVLTERVVAAENAAATVSLFRYRLPVPGEVTLIEAGYIVSAEPAADRARTADVEAIRAASGNGSAAVIREGSWTGPLAVRNRRPGDRFRPLGLEGQKKLQDFFVDRKVARRDRDGVPLVVDESDRIVWVAGHGIDEAFRVTDASQAVVILKLRPS